MKTYYWILICAVILIASLGVLCFVLNSFSNKIVEGSKTQTEVRYVPTPTQPTTQPTIIYQQPTQSAPAQTSAQQKAIEDLKNFKVKDYAPPTFPSSTVPPLTDCQKKGFWNCN